MLHVYEGDVGSAWEWCQIKFPFLDSRILKLTNLKHECIFMGTPEAHVMNAYLCSNTMLSQGCVFSIALMQNATDKLKSDKEIIRSTSII